jgi:hypothetical protein
MYTFSFMALSHPPAPTPRPWIPQENHSHCKSKRKEQTDKYGNGGDISASFMTKINQPNQTNVRGTGHQNLGTTGVTAKMI